MTGSCTDEAEKHIAIVDQNGSSKIDFHEFLLVMTNDDLLKNEICLKEAFEFLDEDKTGYIEK